jgi:hypothetical protein
MAASSPRHVFEPGSSSEEDELPPASVLLAARAGKAKARLSDDEEGPSVVLDEEEKEPPTLSPGAYVWAKWHRVHYAAVLLKHDPSRHKPFLVRFEDGTEEWYLRSKLVCEGDPTFLTCRISDSIGKADLHLRPEEMRKELEKARPYLDNVRAGRVSSARHKAFKSSVARRDSLSRKTRLGRFSEASQEAALDFLFETYPKHHRDYLFFVLLPEALGRVLISTLGLDPETTDVEEELARRDYVSLALLEKRNQHP